MMAAPAGAAMYPLKDRLPAPVYWIYRAVRTLGVALCFAAFWSGAVALCWLWLPVLWLVPGAPADRMPRIHRTVRRGFRLFHFVMRTLRLFHRTSPAPRLRPGDAPVVLVANHPTLCDVTSIASLFPGVVAVASPRFAANPLLGRLVRGCGFVPTGSHMIRDCEARLRMGFDVLVFPEGTRSPFGGGLHPFHRGAFELAIRAKTPIVLLKLTCAPPALSKRLPIWKVADHMAVLTIEPVDVIYPADLGTDSRALCRTIEQRYRDMFGYPGPEVRVPSTVLTSEPQPLGDSP
jgi:1-acyl-sn-glycerol-3-phosphate acyltransferase